MGLIFLSLRSLLERKGWERQGNMAIFCIKGCIFLQPQSKHQVLLSVEFVVPVRRAKFSKVSGVRFQCSASDLAEVQIDQC